jgi:hypothetical protein
MMELPNNPARNSLFFIRRGPGRILIPLMGRVAVEICGFSNRRMGAFSV